MIKIYPKINKNIRILINYSNINFFYQACPALSPQFLETIDKLSHCKMLNSSQIPFWNYPHGIHAISPYRISAKGRTSPYFRPCECNICHTNTYFTIDIIWNPPQQAGQNLYIFKQQKSKNLRGKTIWKCRVYKTT